MAVEVILAEPSSARRAEISYVEGVTVAMALEAAAELPIFKGLELWTLAVGVYGEEVKSDHLLRDGDRVELYRPLQADPKDSRRMRASGKL